MKIEIRVLPFCGMTVPRLPFEKSYSAFIVFTFLSRGTPRRDWTVLAVTLCPDDNKELTRTSKADRYETLFAGGRVILDRHGKRILKHAFRVRK